MHTKEEADLIEMCNSPNLVKEYLDTIKYQYNPDNYVVKSFRRTVKEGSGLCVCGALTAAHILANHGYEPLLLLLRGSPSGHVAMIYEEARWGSLAISSKEGGRSRPTDYRTKEELAFDYALYFISEGWEIRDFSFVNLNDVSIEWRFDERNLAQLGIIQEMFGNSFDKVSLLSR